MSQLEEQSQLDPSGRTWIDVMHEQLKQMGQPVSKGHLHKVRRAYNFLLEGGELLQAAWERRRTSAVSKAAEPDTTEGVSDELNDIQSRLASFAQAQAVKAKHDQIHALKEDLEYAKMTIEDLRKKASDHR